MSQRLEGRGRAMTTDAALPDQALQAVALQQLKLPPDAPRVAVRQAVWSRLAEEQFLPPRQLQQSVDWLFVDHAPRDPQSSDLKRAFRSALLRAQAEEYVARFFSLESAERSEVFHRLSAEVAGDMALAWRVARLRSALAVRLSMLDGLPSPVQQLGQYCAELFLLAPPGDRAEIGTAG